MGKIDSLLNQDCDEMEVSPGKQTRTLRGLIKKIGGMTMFECIDDAITVLRRTISRKGRQNRHDLPIPRRAAVGSRYGEYREEISNAEAAQLGEK